MRRLILLAAITAAAACGPKSKSAPIPMLPGDGDTNVAKPTTGNKGGESDPWAGRADLIVPPQAKDPAAVELPKIEEMELSNGLKVFVIKSDRLPVVSMQLAVKAGRMHEPRTR